MISVKANAMANIPIPPFIAFWPAYETTPTTITKAPNAVISSSRWSLITVKSTSVAIHSNALMNDFKDQENVNSINAPPSPTLPAIAPTAPTATANVKVKPITPMIDSNGLVICDNALSISITALT